MIERVAANAVMHLELGPETRETINAALPPRDSNKNEGVAGVLHKGADAARRKYRRQRHRRARGSQLDGVAR